jgi:transcriptional regulator GlxA family with amidase domain
MIEVALLAIPDITASTLYGMHDIFSGVGRDWGLVTSGVPGPAPVHSRVVGRAADGFEAANRVFVRPHCTLTDCPRPDLVCVPEVFAAPETDLRRRYAEEIDWIRDCFEAGAMIATACSGALLVAEAGLLEGQEATTHWAFCDALAQRAPGARVLPNRALVISGPAQRLVMAGGGTSWHDLALYLVARLVGVEAAMQLAKVYLIDWHSIGQQPFAMLARSRQVGDAVIGRCQAWLAEHYDQEAPVAAVVALSGLPQRSFKRRFAAATGMSPLEYVHNLRLEEAKQMLESGDLPVEAVANEVGYEDASFFGRLFRRKVGLTPAQYRRRFGGLRRALQEGCSGG